MSESGEEHPEPVSVAVFTTTGEAEVLEAKLRSFGIQAEIIDEVEGGLVPVEGESGVHVLVRATDAEAARSIVNEGANSPDDA